MMTIPTGMVSQPKLSTASVDTVDAISGNLLTLLVGPHAFQSCVIDRIEPMLK
jgi:hypothetical protein